MWPIDVHIRDGARRLLEIVVEEAGDLVVAEGHDTHGAAAALRIERDPEFTATGGGVAQVYQHERDGVLAGEVEELDGGAGGANVVAGETKLREQWNRDSIIPLEEHDKRRGGCAVIGVLRGSRKLIRRHLLPTSPHLTCLPDMPIRHCGTLSFQPGMRATQVYHSDLPYAARIRSAFVLRDR